MLINRKLNAIEADRHHEINFVKAELRATGIQVDTKDEERLGRIEKLLVLVAVPGAIFFISKLGVLLGSLLTAFCTAILCITYANSFLRLTGGADLPIPLGERLDTASRKIHEWIRLIVEDLRETRD